jgi:hypothetical protein
VLLEGSIVPAGRERHLNVGAERAEHVRMLRSGATRRRRVALVGVVLAASCVIVSAATPVAGYAATGAPSNTDAGDDADWVLTAQRADGSIATSTDRAVVAPYQANLAVVGLADAASATGDARYSDAAWRALDWYAGHEGPNGFVTDYQVVAGELVSTGTMDSTDAYAGTFLVAARQVWRAAPDVRQLRDLSPGIRGAIDAIEATMDLDGLTWAKPSWHVKYLMDQAEAYAGLLAAAQLERELNDAVQQTRATALALRMKTGVDALWNPSTESYDWAVHEDGARVATNWATLYPDAMEQAWAVAFGVVDPTRALALMQQFATQHPEWSTPTAPTTIDGRADVVGYWPEVAWAFRRIGLGTYADDAVATIRAAALAASRAWPFCTADAGALIVAETGSDLAVVTAAGTGAKRTGRSQPGR